MADDSELDYLRTLIAYFCTNSTVKHYSEIRKISAIDDTRRILIFPPELINVNGSFYTKRYRVQLSEPSEADLMETFNNLLNGIDELNRGEITTAYYTGISFSVNSEDTSPYGIVFDGTYFWIIGNSNDRCYKYNNSGIYQSVNFNIVDQDNDPFGIEWDGTYFWIIGYQGTVAMKYNSAGIWQSEVDISTEDTVPIGITWDGTYFWMVGSNNAAVFKYDSNFLYQNESFSVSSEELNPIGIAWDGTYFWIVGQENDTLYQYTSAGVYTGVSFDISSEDNSPHNIDWDGTHLWVTGDENNSVYKYNTRFYTKPDILVYIELAYGNRAYEVGTTKRWYQDIFIDVEWSTE